MLIGKEVTHEYRGRGTVVAVENGSVTVRFGADYDLQFPYPDEFQRMLRLREYDPQTQRQIDEDVRQSKIARAQAYQKKKAEHALETE